MNFFLALLNLGLGIFNAYRYTNAPSSLSLFAAMFCTAIGVQIFCKAV